MAASYPSATKSFSTKTAGQTVSSAHINDLQDEVVAIENGLLSGVMTASQVVFPAVQVASTDANTLDDYEEGTWTPVLGGVSGTTGQTYTTQVGRYVKIGKLVMAQFNIVLSAKGTITGALQVQGLPFTIENVTNAQPPLTVSIWLSAASSLVFMGGAGVENTTAATIYGATAAATSLSQLTTSDIGNTTRINGSITYRASA